MHQTDALTGGATLKQKVTSLGGIKTDEHQSPDKRNPNNTAETLHTHTTINVINIHRAFCNGILGWFSVQYSTTVLHIVSWDSIIIMNRPGVGDSSVVEPAPQDTKMLRGCGFNPTAVLLLGRCATGVLRPAEKLRATWRCIWQPCP